MKEYAVQRQAQSMIWKTNRHVKKGQEMPMKLTSQQKKYIIYSLVVNDVIYILMGLFFYAAYECQLDEMMRAALCGVSGTKTPFILYTHVWIGFLLKGLSVLLPSFSWYYAYLSVCVLAALSVICYVIMKRTGNKIGLTVSVVLASFVGYECYVLPGCMKTAAVLGMAALTVLMDAAEAGALKGRGRKVFLLVFVILGSMVQLSVFFISLAAGLLGLGVYYGILHGRELTAWVKKQKESETFRPFVVTLAGILFLLVLVWGTDHAAYQIHGQADAGKYRFAMLRMYGCGMGDYDAAYEQRYGIDGEEYAAIKNGSFGVLGKEGWKILEDISKEGRDVTGKRINRFFKTVPLALFKEGIFYLWLVMLFLLFFSPIEGAVKKRLVWAQVVLLLFYFLCAYLCNAWQNGWMVFVLILPLLLPLFFALKGAPEADYPYLWVFLTVFSVILYSKFSPEMLTSVSEENMWERFAALDRDKINVIDLNAYFKSFGAQRVCAGSLLQTGNVRVSNGAYALMEGFEGSVFSAYPSEDGVYEWVYNPRELSVWSLVFED